MKRVKNLIKLANQNNQAVSKENLSVATGGALPIWCFCACFYGGCGGSATGANDSANDAIDAMSNAPDYGAEWSVA